MFRHQTQVRHRHQRHHPQRKQQQKRRKLHPLNLCIAGLHSRDEPEESATHKLMELIRQTFSKEFLKKAHIKLFDCRTVEADEGKILSYVKELKQRMTVNELSFSVGVVQRYLILEIAATPHTPADVIDLQVCCSNKKNLTGKYLAPIDSHSKVGSSIRSSLPLEKYANKLNIGFKTPEIRFSFEGGSSYSNLFYYQTVINFIPLKIPSILLNIPNSKKGLPEIRGKIFDLIKLVDHFRANKSTFRINFLPAMLSEEEQKLLKAKQFLESQGDGNISFGSKPDKKPKFGPVPVHDDSDLDVDPQDEMMKLTFGKKSSPEHASANHEEEAGINLDQNEAQNPDQTQETPNQPNQGQNEPKRMVCPGNRWLHASFGDQTSLWERIDQPQNVEEEAQERTENELSSGQEESLQDQTNLWDQIDKPQDPAIEDKTNLWDEIDKPQEEVFDQAEAPGVPAKSEMLQKAKSELEFSQVIDQLSFDDTGTGLLAEDQANGKDEENEKSQALKAMFNLDDGPGVTGYFISNLPESGHSPQDESVHQEASAKTALHFEKFTISEAGMISGYGDTSTGLKFITQGNIVNPSNAILQTTFPNNPQMSFSVSGYLCHPAIIRGTGINYFNNRQIELQLEIKTMNWKGTMAGKTSQGPIEHDLSIDLAVFKSGNIFGTGNEIGKDYVIFGMFKSGKVRMKKFSNGMNPVEFYLDMKVDEQNECEVMEGPWTESRMYNPFDQKAGIEQPVNERGRVRLVKPGMSLLGALLMMCKYENNNGVSQNE